MVSNLDILNSRFVQSFTRLFGIAGTDPTTQIQPGIWPTAEMDSERPERQFLSSQRLFWGVGFATGGGAQFPGIGLSLTSVTTGIACVLEYLAIQLTAVPGSVNLWMGNIAAPATPVTPVSRDTRLLLTAGLGSVGQMGTSTNYPNPAIGFAWSQNLILAEKVLVPVPLVLTPPLVNTNSIVVQGGVATMSLIVCMAWRERPLLGAETRS